MYLGLKSVKMMTIGYLYMLWQIQDCRRDIMAKHYIRQDDNGFVIKGFSDIFEQPLETDVCICEDGGRHFEYRGYCFVRSARP